MSEIESISKKEEVDLKRTRFELIHISMAILNSVIIIILFTLLRNSILLLTVFGLVFLSVLLLGTIVTFLKRNPYYVIFCYGLTLCGVFGNLLNFLENFYFGIIFIFQGLYIYGIIDYTILMDRHFSDFYGGAEPSDNYIFPRKTQKQASEEKFRQALVEKKRRKIESKFKFLPIALITIGCSFGLFLTLILSA